jgi:hypothetical protein
MHNHSILKGLPKACRLKEPTSSPWPEMLPVFSGLWSFISSTSASQNMVPLAESSMMCPFGAVAVAGVGMVTVSSEGDGRCCASGL